MRFRGTVSVVSLSLVLSACVTIPKINTNDPSAVSSSISVKRDDFMKVTKYEGPNTATDGNDNVFLRAIKPDGAKAEYLIYVADYYTYTNNWRFYHSAYDSNGNSLKVNVILREVKSCNSTWCSYIEHLGLDVSRDYLEKNQETGIRFKIVGKAGEEVFFIPSGYIKAFLAVTK